jgi:hypothetical protein
VEVYQTPEGGNQLMRRYNPRASMSLVETLDEKLSLSALSVSGLITASAAMRVRATGFDDPLPGPEPPPSYPGGEPPIEYPVLPPSGPSGPGL